MKTLPKFVLCPLILFVGCGQPNQRQVQTLDTQPITLFSTYEFQLPNGFIKQDEHNWLYQYERKLGKLYLAEIENPSGDLTSILEEFQRDMLEGNLMDYELQQKESINTDEKIGQIWFYRRNENKNKNNPYAVYTYHGIGVLKYDGKLFKILSWSLGLNLNPTINKIFFQIKKIKNDVPTSVSQQSLSAKPKIDLNNMTVFTSHRLAAPEKYKYQGENTNSSLQLRYKNLSNNVTYYLTSQQLPQNTDVGYYLDSYKTNMTNDGLSVEGIQYQGLEALLGKRQIQTAFIYQLHFVNSGKGQTIQMLAGEPSDKEFDNYIKEIIILK